MGLTVAFAHAPLASCVSLLLEMGRLRTTQLLFLNPFRYCHRAPCRVPPDVISKRVSVAVWAHVRQCDPSLPFNWRDDPPQEIRALLLDLLHEALELIILLSRLVADLL